MPSLILQYQKQFASPTNGTFEASKGNWADHGTHYAAQTTTAAQVRTGIGALVMANDIAPGGSGDYSTDNISLDATYMPALKLANTYKIRLYAKCSAGTPSLTIANAGDNTGTSTALNSTTWTKCELSFTATAADVATPLIKLWCVAAATIYIDDVQVIEYSTFANAIAVSGSDYPDRIQPFPDILERALDGSYIRQSPKCYNRMINLNIGTVSLKAQQVFLANFAWQGLYNSYILGSEEVEVVLPDIATFGNTWLEDCELMRYYNFDVIEKTARTTDPSSWS